MGLADCVLAETGLGPILTLSLGKRASHHGLGSLVKWGQELAAGRPLGRISWAVILLPRNKPPPGQCPELEFCLRLLCSSTPTPLSPKEVCLNSVSCLTDKILVFWPFRLFYSTTPHTITHTLDSPYNTFLPLLHQANYLTFNSLFKCHLLCEAFL